MGRIPKWLRDFEAAFVLVDGCIIREDCLHEWEAMIPLQGQRARVESQINHTHFDADLGSTELERWRVNQALAVATRTRWLDRLAVQFPGRPFIAPIHNEFVVGQDLVRVMSTLRIWSARNDRDHSLAQAFGVDDELNMIASGEYAIHPVDHWTEIFTHNGRIRKSVIKTLMAEFEAK